MPISKKDLRAEMQKALGAMSHAERHDKSALIQSKLLNDALYSNAKTILAYASFGTEVETTEILEACLRNGKYLILSRINSKDKSMSLHQVSNLSRDLDLNKYGIPEPRPDAPVVDLAAVDVILAPGLAFSESGERLGRGQGYYDRLLDRKPAAKTIGLAFDLQIFPSGHFETLPHDLKVNGVITESRHLKF